jgi:hypothetical protein
VKRKETVCEHTKTFLREQNIYASWRCYLDIENRGTYKGSKTLKTRKLAVI